MRFKYQALIDGLHLLVPCPDSNTKSVDIEAYRWVKESFEDGESFLPNYIYDEKRGKKPRKNDKGDEWKCGMCALSFFDSPKASENCVETIGGPERVFKLLGYTHLAKGKIETADGVATIVDEAGHFLFFEFKQIDLEGKFVILSHL